MYSCPVTKMSVRRTSTVILFCLSETAVNYKRSLTFPN